MSNAISGVLTQKPNSQEPATGQTRRFSVEQRPKRDKPDETWNKLKNEGEGFGTEYNILKCDRMDDYNHPQHGTFHQFSLLIAPTNGTGAPVGGSESAPNASNARSGGGSSDEQREAQIARAVAFKGAVELAATYEQKAETAKTTAEVVSLVREYAEALLPIVRGESGNDVPLDTAESVQADSPDSDIPF